MRRRSILSSGGVKVTLSSYSQTVEPNASSITITAYANGQPITDATSSMLTKDGSKITSATINSNGVITISYNRNTSTSSSKTGWVKFTYKEQTVQFNLTQRNDYVTSTSTSSTYSDSREVVTNVNYDSFYRILLIPIEYDCGYPSTVRFTNCDGTIYTTSYYYLYTYYKSGNSTSKKVTEETQTQSTSLTASFESSQTYGLVVGQTYTGTFYFGSDSVSATVTVTRDDGLHYPYGDITITHNGSIVAKMTNYIIEYYCPGE